MFFNHAAPYEMPHMILAAYMVTGFTVAGVYAAGVLRGRRDRYHYTGFAIPFVLAAVLTPVQIYVGDTAARSIAHDQPVKFASMEYVPQHHPARPGMARRRVPQRARLRRAADSRTSTRCWSGSGPAPGSPAGTACRPRSGRRWCG